MILRYCYGKLKIISSVFQTCLQTRLAAFKRAHVRLPTLFPFFLLFFFIFVFLLAKPSLSPLPLYPGHSPRHFCDPVTMHTFFPSFHPHLSSPSSSSSSTSLLKMKKRLLFLLPSRTVGNPVLALISDLENLQSTPIPTVVDLIPIVGIAQRKRRIEFLPEIHLLSKILYNHKRKITTTKKKNAGKKNKIY